MKYAIALLLMLPAVGWGQDSKACAKQAAKAYEERSRLEPDLPPTLYTYTSHYDSAANICYVMFYKAYEKEKGSSISSESIAVLDAFQGRTYGTFLATPMGHVETCTVSRPDRVPVESNHSNDNDCHSEAEFKALVFKLYGITPSPGTVHRTLPAAPGPHPWPRPRPWPASEL